MASDFRSTMLVMLLAPAFVPSDATAQDQEPQFEFNSVFLQGGSDVDVSRFSQGNPVLPGDYLVDLLFNDRWLGRTTVEFIGQADSDQAQPCIDSSILNRLDIDYEKLSAAALALVPAPDSEDCADLQAMIADASVEFDLSLLRLTVSVPQAALLRQPRGYVSPDLWDSGIPSATLSYNFNAYRASNFGRGTTRAYAGLTAGFNLGSWHLRHRAAVDVASGESSEYESIATYLAHDIAAIRSDLTLGDVFTDDAVFPSFRFRGVSLASNEQMLPDSRLEYAPVVRGIARTNARVVIMQNGVTVLETTVSPGAFEIDDLYATGYGGDLTVLIYEADGAEESFTVPYAAMPQLLRPGVWRYAATAGELHQSVSEAAERFAQATVQRGFNNLLTGAAGIIKSDHYEAALIGLAFNTRAGAISTDVTSARASILDASEHSGHSVRLAYSKRLRNTGTDITLAAYRYSSRNYYAFAAAQLARQAAQNGSDPDVAVRARSQSQVSINQNLPGRWGDFYLSASVFDYWQQRGETTQYQAGYTNHFLVGDIRMTWGISASRQNDVLTGEPEDRIQLNFSLPLGRAERSPMLSTSFVRSSSGDTRTRTGQSVISGVLGRNSQLSYSATASKTPDDTAFSASAQYRAAVASVSTTVSNGAGYSQQSLGATGGAVLHRGGITFSNQMTDTIGIIEAQGAEGARVTNSIGTVVNRSGFAVLPYIRPYRMNQINIDPNGTVSPHVEFRSTTETIAPRLNSVVLIRFDTVSGRAILITARQPDGSEVPFGASVLDLDGSEIGLAGQDGRIYLRGIAEAGMLVARWGEAADQRCAFNYEIPGELNDEDPFVRIDTVCSAELVPAGMLDDRSAEQP